MPIRSGWNYYLKSGGYMASEWICYLTIWHATTLGNGHYVSGTYKLDGKEHLFQATRAQWISEVSTEGGFTKDYTAIPSSILDTVVTRFSFYYNVAEKDLNMQICGFIAKLKN